MIINNIVKDLETNRSKALDGRQQYNNRQYSSIGLCNNSQWTYYTLFRPCFVFSACFDCPSNKIPTNLTK